MQLQPSKHFEHVMHHPTSVLVGLNIHSFAHFSVLFERLNRTLYSWLEGEIVEGERIRRIQWLVSTFNQHGEVREWVDIKTDQDARRMMHYMFKIVLMVVIA